MYNKYTVMLDGHFLIHNKVLVMLEHFSIYSGDTVIVDGRNYEIFLQMQQHNRTIFTKTVQKENENLNF